MIFPGYRHFDNFIFFFLGQLDVGWDKSCAERTFCKDSTEKVRKFECGDKGVSKRSRTKKAQLKIHSWNGKDPTDKGKKTEMKCF